MQKISEHAIYKKYQVSRHTLERWRILAKIKPIKSIRGVKGGKRYAYNEEEVIHIMSLALRIQ